MEGFKKIVKMKCGGAVAKAKEFCSGGRMKKGGEVDASDIKQDKAIVKKAFKMHDKQEHKGEHTDLSSLRKGGRAKRQGKVNRYKSGGEVSNVYEAKKSSGDKDNIRKTKLIKPGKADAPSGAKEMPNFKGGKRVVKKAKKPSMPIPEAAMIPPSPTMPASAAPSAPVAPSAPMGGLSQATPDQSAMPAMKRGKKVC